MDEVLIEVVGQRAFLDEAVHELAQLRLEQAQVVLGSRVLEIGKQRLDPVPHQLVEFAVQAVEQYTRRGGRWLLSRRIYRPNYLLFNYLYIIFGI
jgi:hypothetical protein